MVNEVFVVVNNAGYTLQDIRNMVFKKQEEIKLRFDSVIENVWDDKYKKELANECNNVLKNVTVVFDVAKLGYTKETLDFIRNLINASNSEDFNKISLSILDSDNLINEANMPVLLSRTEIEFIKTLEGYVQSESKVSCKSVGIRELPEENDNSLDTLIKANSIIDEVAKEIIDNKFSPFEAVVYAHRFCTKFFYTCGDYRTGSKTVDNLVDSGSIVCVGYATLFKSILDKANVKGLKVGLNAVYNKRRGSGHANNYVEIDDEKYNISGTYVNDCTNDAIDEKFEGTFTSCLISLKDLDNMYSPYFYGKTNVKMGDFVSSNLMCVPRKNKKLDDRSLSKQIAEHLQFIDKNSPQISLEKYRDCISYIINKTNSATNVDEMISQTINRSTYLYHSYAENCFREEAVRLGFHKSSSEKILLERKRRRLREKYFFPDFSDENFDFDEFNRKKEERDKIIDEIDARLEEIRDYKYKRDDIRAKKKSRNNK